MTNPFNNPYQEEQYWRYTMTQYVSRGEREALILFSTMRAMEDPALATRTISSSALAQRSVDRMFENAIAIKEAKTKRQAVQQRIAEMETQEPATAQRLRAELQRYQPRFDQPAYNRGADAGTPWPSSSALATRPRSMLGPWAGGLEAAERERERGGEQRTRSRSPHRVRNEHL